MFEIGALGHGALALLYAALSALLLLNWRGTFRAAFLIGACLTSAIWAGVLALHLLQGYVPEVFRYAADVARLGAWTLLLGILCTRVGVSRTAVSIGNVLWIGAMLAGLLALTAWSGRVSADFDAILGMVGLLTAVIGLLFCEQLYRNHAIDSRSRIRPLVFALGGIFAYDILVYSQVFLIDEGQSIAWRFRGIVNIAFVPFIAIAARRNPGWDLDIFVSRQVVFYTTTMTAVGLYLLLVSIVSFWLLQWGSGWTLVLQLGSFVISAIFLGMFLLSRPIRARVKVFLSKHFFRNKYDYREEWLRLISTMSAFDEKSQREIAIKALAQIVGSPSGMLWLRNESDEVYEPAAALDMPASRVVLPDADPIVSFMRAEGWLIDLEELAANPSLYGGLCPPDWLLETDGAWLVIPLFARNEILGVVLLSKSAGPLALNYEDRDLLKTVGNHVAVHLAQELADEQLAEARQFEAYNRLTAFLMHDLNNLVAQLSLVVKNAEKHKTKPEFVDDAMQTIANSVDRMNRIMDQLKRGSDVSHDRETLLKFVVSKAADRCAARLPVPELEFDDDEARVMLDSEQLSMVVTHIIQNAQDATPHDGSIIVRTTRDARHARIEVKDSGSGMTEEFIRDRMFRPFDSTKGTKGMGIGAYQAREFARKNGGNLTVQSQPQQGTVVTLSVPLSAD